MVVEESTDEVAHQIGARACPVCLSVVVGAGEERARIVEYRQRQRADAAAGRAWFSAGAGGRLCARCAQAAPRAQHGSRAQQAQVAARRARILELQRGSEICLLYTSDAADE